MAWDFSTDPEYQRKPEAVERALEQHTVRCALRQELTDGWTVRLGPVDKQTMLVALGAVVH